MRTLLVAPEAAREFQHLILFSHDRWGEAAARRYEALFEQAYMDLRREPERAGVRPTGDGRWLYPIRHSRPRLPPGERVGRPRHLLLFRHDPFSLRRMALGGTSVGDPFRVLDLVLNPRGRYTVVRCDSRRVAAVILHA